ncbi:ATP-dependent DNA helicase RecG [Phaeovibrio sulfidiphilus]|uniref:ATP-dependent DNA helicase RecG n=1 Tax=Phaeovibrio sulfidiphilus TaxID=1220600 RepID=A0A8J6YQF8_9PROT|nr:ATP-dependent DNA helicase RecG [Phaeovibrio sulfidiphilus]MBE1237826.1 ATP-dependent DNA helicase RecG [Phaeovibrio sulfidiphilus]
MRPSSLDPLFRPFDSFRGVGKALSAALERLLGGTVALDALWHLPTGLVDRRFRPSVADAPPGAIVTLDVQVEAHFPPASRSRPYRVLVSDSTGEVQLVWFRARETWIRDMLPVGARRIVSGKIEVFDGRRQMVHPSHVLPLEQAATLDRVEPVYPLAAGVSGRALEKLVDQILESLPDLPEWLDPTLVAREGWPTWTEALRRVHRPETPDALQPEDPARRRLAFDELLAGQLALLLVRRRFRRRRGRSLVADNTLRAPALAHVGFTLTGAQARTLQEIDADMASESAMLRLLQGDVGSGKTVVALLALLTAVENGAQAALMAPTDLLARQHLETLRPACAAAGVEIALLSGRDKGRERERVLAALASGALPLVVGTHALFQDGVQFHDLGLVVIDEQHRFGVHQRLALSSKADHAVDVLVMTATPIPRTLTLTHYGDMDVSRIDEKPPGREVPDTRVLPVDRLEDIFSAIGRAIQGGNRVYWVCPLIEESETLDLAAADQRFEQLRSRFGERVGLVHGRMKGPERDAVMAGFSSGSLDILVATTVIEVGVNVPEATVMVVEHAERFGLAQLHQLRGRIGRGTGRSTCLLVYAPPLGSVARARLEVMRTTDDGFLIAEEDLRLRGGGEVLGVRQTGLPVFRLAGGMPDLAELLSVARADAKRILETDPDLEGPRAEALRTLLYLFGQDTAIRTLWSG